MGLLLQAFLCAGVLFKDRKGRGDGESTDAGFLRTKNINQEPNIDMESERKKSSESLPISYHMARPSLGVRR